MKNILAFIFCVLLSTPAFSITAPAQVRPDNEEIRKLTEAGGKVVYLGKEGDLDSWALSAPDGKILNIVYVSSSGAIMHGKIVHATTVADTMPKAGDAAPAFTLPNQEGKDISLSDMKGKWVVLYFYPKDFTGGCSIEAHNFQRDEAKYAAKNAVILGVSVDTVDSHKSFCTKEGLNFMLLSDSGNKVTALYDSQMNLGVSTLAARNTFLVGPDGKIAKVYVGVNPSQHSDDVLADLEKLQAAK